MSKPTSKPCQVCRYVLKCLGSWGQVVAVIECPQCHKQFLARLIQPFNKQTMIKTDAYIWRAFEVMPLEAEPVTDCWRRHDFKGFRCSSCDPTLRTTKNAVFMYQGDKIQGELE